MELKKGYFAWQILLVAVIVLSTIKSVNLSTSFMTYVKLFGFLAIWYLMIIGLASGYSGRKKGFSMLMILYSLNIASFMIIVGTKACLESLIFLLASMNGLLHSALALLGQKYDYNASVKELEFFGNKAEPEVVSVKKDFGPGKYIASNNGEKYHSPKCDWAKKINKKRIVWLQDEADASAKGYVACDCVK
ncbi:MAG: hypothetical protein WC471_02665 [Candidatus Woesearchaeota archaeon]